MQNDTIKNKAKLIQNELYGEHREKILEKSRETNKLKYGVSCIFSHPDFTKRYPGHISNSELELRRFLESLNIPFQTSCRSVIKKDEEHSLELDIYIPSKNVAIEYDGLYWHSEVHKPSNYHQLKSDLCRDKNIRLIHIFGDDWNNKQEICKSIIKASLGIYEQRIFARKCIIKDIDSKVYKQFLENNHIQGAVNSSIRKGLFYNNELVQVVGLGKSRFKKDEMELHRMCTKLNTQVIGGFSKLLRSVSGVKELITYVDLALFDGKGYESIGFEYVSKTKPNYWYLDKGCNVRLSRQKCQKHKLKDLLKEEFDPNLTEVQNMHKAGYVRFFDSGTMKLVYRY